MKVILLVFTLLFASNVLALSAPSIQLSSATTGRIAVQIQTSDSVTGFNVYLNDKYYLTVYPANGATTFEFGGSDGTYCVVGFKKSTSGTQYSECSQSVAFQAQATTQVSGAPTPPNNLTSTRYSSTAGELFWKSASSTGGTGRRITGYKVLRDGKQLDLNNGRSYFDGSLQPNRIYNYKVISVNDKGLESTAAETTINTNNTVAAPATSSSPSTDFSISLSKTQTGLQEGDNASVAVAIQLSRSAAQSQEVLELSIQGDTKIGDQNINFSFDKTTIPANQSSTTLRIKLPVGIAPIKSQRRQVKVRVKGKSSNKQMDAILNIDITPVSAPDVYLLIGQSNMEGYSEIGSKQSGTGQPDEPMARIRQLNVQSNNLSLFSENWHFTNEQKNVHAPVLITAEDPLHEPLWSGQKSKGGSFIGPGLSFAKAALDYTTQQIVLVPAAWGATGFCANNNGDLAWNASKTSNSVLGGTLLADRALTRLNIALRESGGVWRGILWSQGGADSNNTSCIQTYTENLQRLIARLRREARVDERGSSARGDSAAIPLVVATMSKGNEQQANFSNPGSGRSTIDAIHRSVASLVPYSDFIDNDDLVPPAYPCGQSSCVHFGAAANREQGFRLNEALQGIISRSPLN